MFGLGLARLHDVVVAGKSVESAVGNDGVRLGGGLVRLVNALLDDRLDLLQGDVEGALDLVLDTGNVEIGLLYSVGDDELLNPVLHSLNLDAFLVRVYLRLVDCLRTHDPRNNDSLLILLLPFLEIPRRDPRSFSIRTLSYASLAAVAPLPLHALLTLLSFLLRALPGPHLGSGHSWRLGRDGGLNHAARVLLTLQGQL